MSVWGWALPSTQALCPRPGTEPLCTASSRQEPRAPLLQSVSGTQIFLSPRCSLFCARGQGLGRLRSFSAFRQGLDFPTTLL